MFLLSCLPLLLLRIFLCLLLHILFLGWTVINVCAYGLNAFELTTAITIKFLFMLDLLLFTSTLTLTNISLLLCRRLPFPFVAGLLGKSLKGATVEEGLGGGAPGSKPTYIAMGNMYFDSIEDFQAAFGPNADKIMADIPNFTKIKPVIQISKVLL